MTESICILVIKETCSFKPKEKKIGWVEIFIYLNPGSNPVPQGRVYNDDGIVFDQITIQVNATEYARIKPSPPL